jgi:purine-binding chemotaxis protein CheW
VADLPGAVSLLCRLQSHLLAFPIENVIETMRPLAVEPLAGAPPFVRGVAVVRGAPLPVVDASLLVAGREGPIGRFVSMRVGQRQVVLAVEAVLGIRSIPPASMQALPPLLRDCGTDLVASIGRLDGELLLALSGARLVPEGLA